MDESKAPNDESLDIHSDIPLLNNCFGAGISEEIPSKLLHDNKKIIHLIGAFIADGSTRLSSFLRKKIILESSLIDINCFEEIEPNYKNALMLGFQVEPEGLFGFIAFDFVLLHAVINLLFGGEVGTNEPIMENVGHAGIKIASKIAEICLLVFQNSLNEHLNTDIKLSKISSSLYSVFNQKMDKCVSFAFNMSLETVTGGFSVVIPECTLADITLDSTLHNVTPLDTADTLGSISEQLKHELIESSITIHAMLPDIALLVKDVVNLRAGDIIPIGDPTFVYVMHNQTPLFTATAGQLNSRRMVEITGIL